MDDLYILCGTDTNSIQLVKNTLSGFHKFAGLQHNFQESSIIFVGLDQQLKDDLQTILTIPEGFLPVKYLGVPRITT